MIKDEDENESEVDLIDEDKDINVSRNEENITRFNLER